jgi:hypothetical protein
LGLNAQVIRLKAEVCKIFRKERIKPFKIFSASTTFSSIRDESSLRKNPKRYKPKQPLHPPTQLPEALYDLAWVPQPSAFGLQPSVHLPSQTTIFQ